MSVDSARVGGSQFTLEARRIGKFKLMLTANMKGDAARADIVVREIEVVPNGCYAAGRCIRTAGSRSFHGQRFENQQAACIQSTKNLVVK